MSLLSRVSRLTSHTGSSRALLPDNGPLALYDELHAYYLNNEMYTDIGAYLKENGRWTEGMRPYRNPAFRATEFHVSHIWPGKLSHGLPIVTENEPLIDCIELIWQWSNWATKKQLAARWFALMGDLFIKVAYNKEKTRVFFQVLDPRWVTDFDTDERGIMTYVRVDIPQETVTNGRLERSWHTEYWEPDQYRIWHHKQQGASIDRLGNAKEQGVNGLGFVPIVHAPFRDIGETRGLGCFVHTLGKIDEANRMVTRLHQMLFRHNKPVWALLANGNSSDPRPAPAPRIGATGTNEIDIGDEVIISIPGSGQLELLVPDIKYDSALAILNAHMTEIEQDLPELKYYQLSEQQGASGVALSYMLSDAIDRVIEARGNGYAALIRANQIACTMAQMAQIKGFSVAEIGTYEAGSFEHVIGDVPVIPPSPKDQSETFKMLTDGGLPVIIAMRRCGFSEAEIAEYQKEQAATQAREDAAIERAERAAQQAAQNAPEQPVMNQDAPEDDSDSPEQATDE